MIAGMMTRKRLMERRKQIQTIEDRKLDNIITKTAEISAL